MGSNRRRLSSADPLKQWAGRLARRCVSEDEGHDPMALVGFVVDRAFAGLSVNGANRSLLSTSSSLDVFDDFDDRDDCDDPPGGWANPWLPGLVHEQAVSASVRRDRGAWYTPPDLVRGLVRLVARSTDMPSFAVDPTCGGGAFLLALLDHWVAHGVEPADALRRVAGYDIDPDAVTVCRLSLELWASTQGMAVEREALAESVKVADALTVEHPVHWPEHRLVIGNPPFATPLKSSNNTIIPDSAEAYRHANSEDLGQYADLAAIHLHRAVVTAPAGSPVAMVMPQSVLSSRDVAGLRSRIASGSNTVAMWAAREAVFDAGVRACAPVVVVGERSAGEVTLATGPMAGIVGQAAVGESSAVEWAPCAARALGAPAIPSTVTRPSAVLADLCSATAGFRDEYYGLASAAAEWNGPGPPPNRLVTVGSVDPLCTRWGTGTTRLGGQRWSAPYVRTDQLDPKVRRWVERQSVSKLVVATQSKLIEPVLDPGGELVPSTPLLSVHGRVDDLPYIAAVLLAPPVVAAAWQRWFGSALAVDALKMAASQLVELPLPDDRPMWNSAAELISSTLTSHPSGLPVDEGWAAAVEVAALMNRAFRAESHVFDWWVDRIPDRNTPVSAKADR